MLGLRGVLYVICLIEYGRSNPAVQVIYLYIRGLLWIEVEDVSHRLRFRCFAEKKIVLLRWNPCRLNV